MLTIIVIVFSVIVMLTMGLLTLLTVRSYDRLTDAINDLTLGFNNLTDSMKGKCNDR